MSPIPFASLNKSQRQQVTYLFADALFGTDAKGYLYELNKDGEVSGRTADGGRKTERRRSHIRPVISVKLQEVKVTDKLIQRSSMNADALAAIVARKIYQSQLEEVTV